MHDNMKEYFAEYSLMHNGKVRRIRDNKRVYSTVMIYLLKPLDFTSHELLIFKSSAYGFYKLLL